MKALVTDTLAIEAKTIPVTVIATLLDTAVVAGEMREAHAFPIHTAALVVAVVGAHQHAAIISRVALMADALAIHAAPVVVALVRAGGYGAVWAFPSCVTEAAACVLLVGSVAAAACVHTCATNKCTVKSCLAVRFLLFML